MTGITAAEAFLMKPFFVANGLMPSTTFVEALYAFPARDFQNLGAGALTIVDGLCKVSGGAAGNNFGWDLGAVKGKVLFIISGYRAPGSVLGPFMSNTIPGASELVDGYLFWPVQSGVQIYKFVAGVPTLLVTETTFVPPPSDAGMMNVGLACYFDGGTNTLKIFLRYGTDDWLEVLTLSDVTYTTARYIGIRMNNNVNTWLNCAIGIYAQ